MRHQPLSAMYQRLQAALSRRSVLTAVALLGALFSANCSDVPTSPTELAGPGSDLGTAASYPRLTSGPEWTVVQPMTNEGGVMLLDGTDVLCDFPAGALTVSATNITASMKLNAPRGRATRIEFDFQPSMEFEKPVELKLVSNYLSGSSRKYVLWYFDPQDDRWEKQDEQPIVDGNPIVFKIYHYSGYAVSR